MNGVHVAQDWIQ